VAARKLPDIKWFVDREADESGEPGIFHSYMASLATALNYVEGDLDPVWLVGSSAFAFRIWVNEVICPSAMSIFEWDAILPEAVEQMGYRCAYVSRLWHEESQKDERRKEAHTKITDAIDRGIPAVAWDVAYVEWGLIIGYDDDAKAYDTFTTRGELSTLRYDRLGQNGIDVLSVAIPDRPNGRERPEIIARSLAAAVAHAEQREWTERPRYQNGLAGFDLWALTFDRWAMIAGAGRCENLSPDVPKHAAYYAGHYYSARCYARDYLKAIADGNERLKEAVSAYERVASSLEPVWNALKDEKEPDCKTLASLARSVRDAKTAEEQGLAAIKEYLAAGQTPL
jgi:hypothetical protein